MLTYNQVRKYEVGSSFRWAASIVGGPGPIQDAELNLLNGKFIPALDIELSDIDVKTKEIPVIKDFSIKIPYISVPIDAVTITFIDNSAGAIRNAINKWSSYSSMLNGRAPSLSKYYKLLKLYIYNPDNSISFTRTLYIVPKDTVTLSKDGNNEADSYKVEFTVVGAE